MKKLKNNCAAFTLLLYIYSSNAMEKGLPLLPADVFYDYFIPLAMKEIVRAERRSVKTARCDLDNVRMVNKKTNVLVNSHLETDSFNTFFIDTLANNDLLEGNKITIAAHLGSTSSLKFIVEYLKIKYLETSNKKKLELFNSIIQLNELEKKSYMKNAHKLLWHLAHLITNKTVELLDTEDPTLWIGDFCYEEPVSIDRLQNDTKITKRILYLFLHSGFSYEDLPHHFTLLMQCCILYRSDLLSLVYNEKTLNQQDLKGNTALMHCVHAALEDRENKQKSLETFDFVLSKDPYLMLRNKQHCSALDIASLHKNKSSDQGQYIINRLRNALFNEPLENASL